MVVVKVSKFRLFVILNSSKNWTKKFDLQYYDTSGRLIFFRFLEQLKTLKSPLKINWPLVRFLKVNFLQKSKECLIKWTEILSASLLIINKIMRVIAEFN